MFILFDQGTPLPLRLYLRDHSIRTTTEQGWERLKNGELLKAAEDDVLLTTDKNIRFQQNLLGRKIAIIVICLQQWPQLRSNVQRVVDAVNTITPGKYVEVLREAE